MHVNLVAAEAEVTPSAIVAAAVAPARATLTHLRIETSSFDLARNVFAEAQQCAKR